MAAAATTEITLLRKNHGDPELGHLGENGNHAEPASAPSQ
jgi:hypothetical protein